MLEAEQEEIFTNSLMTMHLGRGSQPSFFYDLPGNLWQKGAGNPRVLGNKVQVEEAGVKFKSLLIYWKHSKRKVCTCKGGSGESTHAFSYCFEELFQSDSDGHKPTTIVFRIYFH